MKIMYIIRSLANAHGVERTFIDKACYLAEHGHQVIMVTYEQGCHVYAYPISPLVECVDLNCRYFTLFNYSLIKRQYEAWKIKRSFLHRIHTLVFDRLPDIVVASTYEGEFMNEIISLKSNTRVVLESHSAFVGYMKGGNLKSRIHKKFVLQKIKHCDLLIALTHGDAECWQKYVQNIVVVPNPICQYPELIKGVCEKEKGRIIAVGSLQNVKRFDRLIDAFALIALKYPEWSVDIFGEGPDKLTLDNMVKSHDLVGRVNFKGKTNDVYIEYQKSQFLVLSSDYEGFGLVLIEAMACGIPVVSTDCPFGPSEIVENGVTGILAKMDAFDLASKMEWMITHDEERIEMGKNARLAASRYKKEIVMKEWERAYQSVLQ